jgi:methylase of polypeptide subunit release factors
VKAAAPVLNRPLVARLARVLADVQYNATSIQQALGTEGDLLARPGDVPVHLRRLERSPEPFATLVALFVLPVSLDAAEAEERLTEPLLALLHELGLLELRDSEARGAVRIIPHDHLLIASDRGRSDIGPNHVAGVHRPSAGLAHLTVRRQVRRALDVGTGNGVQALLCAEHAERVVATDVNERALEFAAFNAALNGVENVDFRAGSFFEPVAGERFELVVCNPPYVVTPDSDYLFRDGGMEGDQVSELVATELPGLLEEGGYGTMTASWVLRDSEEDPVERPRRWLVGSGCDAWIVHTSLDDPLTTAAAWNRDSPPEELSGRLDRWLAYYGELKIQAVGYGAFVLRRREAGPNWVQTCIVPRSGIHRAGPHLERLFAAQDYLGSSGDAELGRRRFRLHDDVRLEHSLNPTDEGWSLVGAELVLTDGLPFRAGLDEATSAVIRRVDPSRTLDEVLAGAAVELGVDAGRLRPAGIAFLKQLLELGYAVPA